MKYDVNETTISDMDSTVSDYSVDQKATDGVNEYGETVWDNDKFMQYFAYYKTIPEFKTAINTYATWVIGKGWFTGDNATRLTLDNITGWGEDTFMSILWNMIVMKKVGGDAFAEIMRDDDGTLINLKVLDPASITIVADDKGIIKEYRQKSKTGKKSKPKTFKPHNILHLCNGRVADEIHGTSITEAVEWVILARNEAMSDWRRLSHRSTIRVMYVDVDNPTKIDTIRKQYREAIEAGELMIIPANPNEAEIKDFTLPPVDNFLAWIKYLENFFYQALGVPKVILGGSEEFTEASSKIGYLTFEQIYTKEIEELKADLWNQLAIRVDFVKPASIKNELLNSETKNTGQVGFQPKETTAGLTRE